MTTVAHTSDTTAIVAAINAQYASPVAFAPDKAPAATNCILVWVSRRYMADRMIGGDLRTDGGRVVTRYVAKAYADAAQMRQRTRAALEQQTLASNLGPFVFETEDPTEQDDGWWTGADSFTY